MINQQPVKLWVYISLVVNVCAAVLTQQKGFYSTAIVRPESHHGVMGSNGTLKMTPQVKNLRSLKKRIGRSPTSWIQFQCIRKKSGQEANDEAR